MKKNAWAIWSFEHRAWWAPGGLGYTVSPGHAGIYTASDTCDILSGCEPGNEVPVNKDDVGPEKTRSLMAQTDVMRGRSKEEPAQKRVEYCDRCDGCGWYEGGKTLQTTCEKCGGTGVAR